MTVASDKYKASVYMSEALYKKVQQLAKRRELSISSFLALLARQEVDTAERNGEMNND